MHIGNIPIIDCHVHLFDPQRFPYQTNTRYAPSGAEISTREQLQLLMDTYGVSNALLVAPNSGYGSDNRCLLDAIEHSNGRLKGIAVVDNNITEAELRQLKKAGIVGVAFNATFHGTQYYAHTHALLRLLHSLDMCVQVQVEDDQLIELLPLLEASPITIVIDHCGRPIPTKGITQAGFLALKRLANSGRAYIKLSGFAKFSNLYPPYEDTHPFVQTLITMFTPEHCMWGSDWPFLRANHRADYGVLLTIIDSLLPTAALKQQILYKTAAKLFLFNLTALDADIETPPLSTEA